MASSGTVMSIGPSVKPPKDFLSPRISIAAGMFANSFAGDKGAEEVQNFPGVEAGFGRFAQRLCQELPRALLLGVPAAFTAAFRNERAEALAAVDDAFAFELLVGALHGDHADEQLFG